MTLKRDKILDLLASSRRHPVKLRSSGVGRTYRLQSELMANPLAPSTVQNAAFLVCLHVPDSDEVVVGRTNNAVAVGAESQLAESAFERANFFISLGRPKPAGSRVETRRAVCHRG